MNEATLPYSTTIPCRHTDLDATKLISNVAIADLFEEARTRYSVDRRLKPAFDPSRRFLSSIAITFVEDCRYPAPFQVDIGISVVSETGWTVRLIASQHDCIVARCETTFELRSDAGLATLPDALVSLLRRDLIKDF